MASPRFLYFIVWLNDSKEEIMLKGLFKAVFSNTDEREKAVFSDDKLYRVYRSSRDLIDVCEEVSGLKRADISPQNKLSCGLALIGFIDAVSQAHKLSDQQFWNLWDFYAHTLHFSPEETSHLFDYHQTQQVKDPAYQIILFGGELFSKFQGGNSNAILALNLANDRKTFPGIPGKIFDL